jgi:iron complex transport system permease protein
VLLALAGVLVLACVAGAAFGAVPVSPADVVGAVGASLRGAPLTTSQALVMDLRLPRVALAALVGACLAAAGVLYQALFRNALADPYILGVSSGAGLGAALAFAITGTGALALVAPPLAAFV